jgi:hypothetical protein
MASNAVAASTNMAALQLAAAMMACVIGANTNWPSDPPALITPAAAERCRGLRLRAVLPMRIEKLPAPAPAALSTPSVSSSPDCVVNTVVSARPPASISAPTVRTRNAPK